MSATKDLHDAGQSLWLDYITRDAVNDGTIEGYVRDLSLTGLTSNPTIFDQALSEGDAYDEQTSELLEAGKSGEDLFFELALTRPARRLRPVRRDPRADQRRRRLGLARGLAAARPRHRRAPPPRPRACTPPAIATTSSSRSRERLRACAAIEETIAAGVPVNVTLLFDADQYVAQAEAYMRGIERRVADGLDPNVGSVASLFVSRWDVAARGDEGPRRAPEPARHRPPRSTATSPTASCSRATAGCGSRTRAPARSASSSPRPGPRTRRCRRPTTCASSPRRSRSTRCPRTRCSPSREEDSLDSTSPRRRRRQRRAAGRVRARPAST